MTNIFSKTKTKHVREENFEPNVLYTKSGHDHCVITKLFWQL